VRIDCRDIVKMFKMKIKENWKPQHVNTEMRKKLLLDMTLVEIQSHILAFVFLISHNGPPLECDKFSCFLHFLCLVCLL
ncbi:hypothetical protein ACJX0J_015077, partial [Zea mays]